MSIHDCLRTAMCRSLHGVVAIRGVVYGSPCDRPEKVCFFVLS